MTPEFHLFLASHRVLVNANIEPFISMMLRVPTENLYLYPDDSSPRTLTFAHTFASVGQSLGVPPQPPTCGLFILTGRGCMLGSSGSDCACQT